jgi:hypothetical protein
MTKTEKMIEKLKEKKFYKPIEFKLFHRILIDDIIQIMESETTKTDELLFKFNGWLWEKEYVQQNKLDYSQFIIYIEEFLKCESTKTQVSNYY